MKKTLRNTALDIVRITALLSVVSVHFFRNSGYYSQIVIGNRMYVMTLMRTFFMVCVPLFLVLTGYLMNKKVLSKKYYCGLIKTLGIYVLASIACIIFKYLVLNAEISVMSIIGGILDFSADDYSWYVEMYIGLFLLIPFLNIIYNNLESKGHKMILVVTFLLLTAVPGILNIYNKLFPDWWETIYPITYYFIGCYLNEYAVRIKKTVNILLIAVATFLFGTYYFYHSYGGEFAGGERWGSLPNVILTVLVFILLSNLRMDRVKNQYKRGLACISNVCFGAYLVSYIFDEIFYRKLNMEIEYMPQKLDYFFIIVSLVFICSLALAMVIDVLYIFLTRIIQAIWIKIKRENKRLRNL